jgi:hypothetical protein
MSEPLYVYGLVDAAAPGAELGQGLAAAPVARIPAGPLHAIVSAAPPLPVEGTRRNMLTHTAVLERVLGQADVLPLRFGTVAPDPGQLARGIAGTEAALREALEGVAGRVELGVKASWREGVAFREILAADPRLRALRDRLQARAAAETYYERIELGRRVEAAMLERRAAETAMLLAALSPLADREVELKVLDDGMVLNRAFLVRRADEAAFDAAMAALAEAHAARLEFRYVGPVPPYNFVTVRAGWLAAAA